MWARAKEQHSDARASENSSGLPRILWFAWRRLSRANALHLQLAASLTFTTVLAIVPLLAVVLSLFTAFPLFKEFSDALQAFMANSLMPPAVSENVMSYLNEFASKASHLTAIGGAFLVLTVIFLMMSIESALNAIWDVVRQRRVTQRLLVYWAVMTLGPVVAGASLYTTTALTQGSLGLLANMPLLLEVTLKLVPLLLSGLSIAVLFIVVPHTRVNRADALIGGYVSAIILEIMKIGFSFYVSTFSTYTVIYGAFAALPVFLIWVYLSWLGILMGAVVAANLPLARMGRLDYRSRPGAALMDALSILKLLSQARGNLPTGCTAAELMQCLRVPNDVLRQHLAALNELGLVAAVPDARTERWLLACDPQAATLGPLLDRLALDRASIKLPEQPFLAQVLSDLVMDRSDPSLAEVLLHHDTTLTHPLQSRHASSVAGDIHAKSQ